MIGVNLCEACLIGTKNIPFIPFTCPDFGSFVAWKKAKVRTENGAIECIVQLEIPEDAKRLSGIGHNCRCDKAKVLSIKDLEGNRDFTEAYSLYDRKFIYKVGEEVSVGDFNNNRWKKYATGIHFFINRQEAVDWPL